MSGSPLTTEIDTITQFIDLIDASLNDAKTNTDKPTDNDLAEIQDKLNKYSEDLNKFDESQIKSYGNSVTNKQLEYIITAIDNIYLVSSTKVFKTNTKRLLYHLYEEIYVKTKKYINDLSSDVNSEFYKMLKDEKNYNFSILGKNGFDMENFYHLYKLWFSGMALPPDKKPIGELLTALFKATSKDGKRKNDTTKPTENIETRFTTILNTVIPDIAAIILYGFSLDYKSGVLQKTGKVLSQTSSAISTGITSVGSKISKSLPAMVNPFTIKRMSGGFSNAETRFKPLQFFQVLCHHGDPLRCCADFINFLIGMLLNVDYIEDITTNTTILNTTTGSAIRDLKDINIEKIFIHGTDPNDPDFIIKNNPKQPIQIENFSNIFLYNIWLLIIFKFILNQENLDNVFEPKTPAVEYQLKIMDISGNVISINPPPTAPPGTPIKATDLGIYIEHAILYITEFNKKFINPTLEKFDQTKKKGGNLLNFTSRKYLTKKNKKMLTLKKTLKKKYKKSCYLTKKIKKFRK